VGVDPITFEVFRNALMAIAEQMSAIIWRTSFSTIIREMLPSKTASHALERGDVVRMVTQGGGGHGGPRERDRALILRDLREGKVTPEGLRRDYGLDSPSL